MKKIKVHLQRPWRFADSPYYDYLTKGVSDKIEYMNVKGKHQGITKTLKSFKILNKLKRTIKLTLRVLFPSVINKHYTPPNNFDLIHCAHCFSSNKENWVCDIESIDQFWLGGIESMKQFGFKGIERRQTDKVLEILQRENCKKILPWTEWAKEIIIKAFPEIEDKVEILYPAIPIQNFKKVKSEKIRLLFVSRRFGFKGGFEALEVMDRLMRKYKNVKCLIISEVPEEIKRAYKNKGINFIDFIPKEKLFSDIYPKTDILIYPSSVDTLGFVMLEAMSFGIPVITGEGHSTKEIVQDKKTGFVVKADIDKLTEKTEILIRNKKLRDEMSKNALGLFREGKFSIKKRNKKIEKIYKEALK